MRKKTLLILSLILLLGTVSRIDQLAKGHLGGIFIDEVYTVSHSCPSCKISDMVKYWFSEGHFPTYFILMHYWMRLFGTGEFVVRIPSVIFGVISIYVMFVLGKRLFNEKIGLLGSCFFAVSTINIFHAQIARQYALVTLCVLLSFLFLFEALEKNSRSILWSYAFFTLLSLLLSANTLPIIICQILFVLLSWRRYRGYIRPRQIISILALILLVYLPFLLWLTTSHLKDGQFISLACTSTPSLKTILDNFSLFGGKIYYEPLKKLHVVVDPQLNIFADIYGILLFILCLLGCFVAFKINSASHKIDQRFKVIFLSSWLFIPIILLYVFSLIISPAFGPIRYILYTSPPYYLLISRGIMSLKRSLRFLLIIFILLSSLMFLKEYHSILSQEYRPYPWRQIRVYIKTHAQPQEKVVFSFHSNLTFELLYLRFYRYFGSSFIGVWSDELRARVPSVPTPENMKIPVQIAPEDKKKIKNELLRSTEIIELRKLNCDGFWFVNWNPKLDSEMNSETVRLFSDKYTLVKEDNFDGSLLYHFRKKE